MIALKTQKLHLPGMTHFRQAVVTLFFICISTAVCASTIGTGGTTGIALIDNTWLSLIEFQYQVNTEIAIRMKALETGGSFTALLFALGAPLFTAWLMPLVQVTASSLLSRTSWVARFIC